MAAKLSLRFLSAILIAVSADPSPGRIPKVYNALITSNQNLEPSKSYPVYQPVLHDPFGFAVHPSILYGGDPFGNSIIPQQGIVPPKEADPSVAPPAAPAASAAPPEASSTEPPKESPSSEPNAPPGRADSDGSEAPPPPNTESPIPLNEFGLPPQVLPLGRINPAYNGFTQLGGLGPFTYSYPGVRLYDPYDPFTLGPGYAGYASPYGFSVYRPLTNVLAPGIPLIPAQAPVPAPTPAPADASAQTPPPEPSDLNILNYSSKDPAIPNVPPPPLPQGGLKSDKSE